MYHSISDDSEHGIHPYYRICTPPALFRKHMQFLYDNGYQVISLKDALDLLFLQPAQESVAESSRTLKASGSLRYSPFPAVPTSALPVSRSHGFSPLPTSALPPSALTDYAPSCPHGNYVVLTFDDGYQDFYTHAWPILTDFGFTATVFLPTGLINTAKSGGKISSTTQTKKPLVSADSTPLAPGASLLPSPSLSSPSALTPSRSNGLCPLPPSAFRPHVFSPSRPLLTWSQVQELHARGISFGSHTVNHLQLQDLDKQDIESQLYDSKRQLEDHLELRWSNSPTLMPIPRRTAVSASFSPRPSKRPATPAVLPLESDRLYRGMTCSV